jgi:predicted ArsR family transcriptional regulator
MKTPEKFFTSTRGKIISFLRGRSATVNELAEELGLTDNAVRAHLLSLERDGLLRQSGMRQGHRKPHFEYELMPESEGLFPKAYDTVFSRFIKVLKEKLGGAELEKTLMDTGLALAPARRGSASLESLEDRAEKAAGILNSIGGAARVDKERDRLYIRSRSCPISSVVAEHPEACAIAEALVGEITRTKVEEKCDRTGSPRCAFAISKT